MDPISPSLSDSERLRPRRRLLSRPRARNLSRSSASRGILTPTREAAKGVEIKLHRRSPFYEKFYLFSLSMPSVSIGLVSIFSSRSCFSLSSAIVFCTHLSPLLSSSSFPSLLFFESWIDHAFDILLYSFNSHLIVVLLLFPLHFPFLFLTSFF